MQDGGLEQFRDGELPDAAGGEAQTVQVWGRNPWLPPSRWYADMSDCVVGLYSGAGDPD